MVMVTMVVMMTMMVMVVMMTKNIDDGDLDHYVILTMKVPTLISLVSTVHGSWVAAKSAAAT